MAAEPTHGPHHSCTSSSRLGARGPLLLAIDNVHFCIAAESWRGKRSLWIRSLAASEEKRATHGARKPRTYSLSPRQSSVANTIGSSGNRSVHQGYKQRKLRIPCLCEHPCSYQRTNDMASSHGWAADLERVHVGCSNEACPDLFPERRGDARRRRLARIVPDVYSFHPAPWWLPGPGAGQEYKAVRVLSGGRPRFCLESCVITTTTGTKLA